VKSRPGLLATIAVAAGLAGCGDRQSDSHATSTAQTGAIQSLATQAATTQGSTAPPAASLAAPPGRDPAGPSEGPAPVRLSFVGDIALNYSIGDDIESLAAGHPPKGVEAGFPFDGVAERLRGADIAVGNLECVLSTKGTVDTWHKPFRGPVAGIDSMLGAGIDVVSVANNHSWDFGADGFSDMLHHLDEKKLAVIGRGYRQKSPHEPEKALVRDVRGTKVAFLGFYLESDADLARDVAAASKEADVVVAYFHWGKEKQSDATPEQRQQARTAIDAGADLVVGSHVHVLQPTEMYRGKLIAYGLGNFVFMGMNHEERFRRGAILEVALDRDHILSFELLPTRIDDRGAPRLVVPESSYLPGKDDKAKGDKAKGDKAKGDKAKDDR
jgi:poly-gamma-glutamate synthesis protein (capsule biosynthesis protein)